MDLKKIDWKYVLIIEFCFVVGALLSMILEGTFALLDFIISASIAPVMAILFSFKRDTVVPNIIKVSELTEDQQFWISIICEYAQELQDEGIITSMQKSQIINNLGKKYNKEIRKS